jgi:hypothetical protein
VQGFFVEYLPFPAVGNGSAGQENNLPTRSKADLKRSAIIKGIPLMMEITAS